MKNKKTKVRKALVLLSFCLLNTLSFGQTKEETLSWLQDKFSKYITAFSSAKVTSVNISPCEITINYSSDDNQTVYVMPTEGLEINTSGWFENKRNIILENNLKDNSKNYPTQPHTFYLQKGETDLHLRINTALNHLATFCPPKQKETF